MGVANSLSRLGAILAPFLAVGLVRSGHAGAAEAALGAACLVAAAATLALPIETKDHELAVRLSC